jgi:hypothetical protein
VCDDDDDDVHDIMQEKKDDGGKPKREEFRDDGPKFMVYTAGGATYSEVRCAYEISKDIGCQILIGMWPVWIFLPVFIVIGVDIQFINGLA